MWYHQILLIVILANIFLVHNSAVLACSNKEGEIQVDLAPSSQTMTTVIIEELLAGKAGYKKND